MFRLLDGQPILGGIIMDTARSLRAGDTLDDFHGKIRSAIKARYRGAWGDFLLMLIEHLPDIAAFIQAIYEIFVPKAEANFAAAGSDAPVIQTVVWRGKEYSAAEGSQVANFLDSMLPTEARA